MLRSKYNALYLNVFFYFALSLILFSLGYSFFNNTSNHLEHDTDAAFYLYMVEHAHSPDITDHRSGRILVPELVSIVFKYLNGNVGTWDSLKFSFFSVNAAFMLASIAIYHKILLHLGYLNSHIKVSALIYLVSFASSNYYIKGSVDSGEVLFLAALSWSLLTNRLFFIPIIFILGVTNRETFLAVGLGLTVVDLIYDISTKEKNQKQLFIKCLVIIVSALSGAVTHILVQYNISGDLITPLNSMKKFDDLPTWGSERSYSGEIRRFLYVFLLPIAATLLSNFKLPKRILLHMAGIFMTVIFGSWIASTSGTGLSRYLFAGTGFYFSMYIASLFLDDYKK